LDNLKLHIQIDIALNYVFKTATLSTMWMLIRNKGVL